ncbi:MAG TPA: response regulator [Rhizomicrobium sp.]|nr:response regulator [Rhizomicrobium sp.]
MTNQIEIPFGADIEKSLDLAALPKLCLVVDDSKTIRRFTMQILESLNFIVAEAENGRDAVETCREVSPDLVLLDWNMPEMDGITCLRALRAMTLNPRPVIVMCTTENGMPKIREALECGADEYIMKPFDRDVLFDKLVQLELAERP